MSETYHHTPNTSEELDGPKERLCGYRVRGGIYATLGTSEIGRPIEDFLVCPPQVIDTEALGLSKIGVKLVELGGTYHVLDMVGTKNYPNVADVIEEIRALGMSRRLPKTLDFSLLTRESKVFLIHDRAHIDDTTEYLEVEERTFATRVPEDDFSCPRENPRHTVGRVEEMCLRLCYQDVVDGYQLGFEGRVRRDLPSGSYLGYRRPDGVTPEYTPAIFAALPIQAIHVIEDGEDGHREAMDKTSHVRGISVERRPY